MSPPYSSVHAVHAKSFCPDAADRHRCDFCGDTVSAVRRVALDQAYDRLLKAHRPKYSCASCFDRKEEDRVGLSAIR